MTATITGSSPVLQPAGAHIGQPGAMRRHSIEALVAGANAGLQICVDQLNRELAHANELLRLETKARKQLQLELHESEQRFMTFMDNSPAMAFIKDDKGRYIYGNKRWESFFREKLAGRKKRTDLLLYPAQTARRLRAEDRRILATGVCSETVRKHANGRANWWLFLQFPMLDPRGRTYIGGIAVDITDQRRREKQILEISEREQQRIGQDLHDELCQYLLGIKFKTELLHRKLARSSPAHTHQARIIETMLGSAVDRARRLARGLHPVQVEAGGLGPALKELPADLAAVYQCICTCETPKRILIRDRETAVHLYRIAQEAASNAIKHGHARKIMIRLAAKGDQIVLSVKDNGVGLPGRLPARSGMGLHIMNYRARMIGATLSLFRQARGGTLLTCTLPRRQPAGA